MKKFILLMLLVSIQVFGWSLFKPSETFEWKGYEVTIVNFDEKDQYLFLDNFRKGANDDNFKREMNKRLLELFQLVKETGMKKGYKSFVIVNTGLSFTEVGVNSGEDLATFCLLDSTNDKKSKETKYDSFCQKGDYPLIIPAYLNYINFHVNYFKDDSGNFSTTASY